MSTVAVIRLSTYDSITLSLHDALPISARRAAPRAPRPDPGTAARSHAPAQGLRVHSALRLPRRALRERSPAARIRFRRSEEHTSELQSRRDIVCRLLLAKKKVVGSLVT